jgi:hypothetical protein
LHVEKLHNKHDIVVNDPDFKKMYHTFHKKSKVGDHDVYDEGT